MLLPLLPNTTTTLPSFVTPLLFPPNTITILLPGSRSSLLLQVPVVEDPQRVHHVLRRTTGQLPGIQQHPDCNRPPTSCSSNPVTAATADRADGTPNNLLLILSILLLLVSSHRASQLPTNRPDNQQDPNKRTNQHKNKHSQQRKDRAYLPCLPA